MVWTYFEVKELRKKHREGQEITVPEIRKLEKYVHRKQKVYKYGTGSWGKKQLLKAERLLQELKKENDMLIEVTE